MRTTLQLPSLRLRALLGALALTLGLLGPSTAHAQTPITIVVESFGGRDAPVLLSGTNGRPISAEECEENTPIPLQLTNVPYNDMQTRYLSVWRGTQTSAACHMAANRQSVGTAMPVCTFVDSFEITGTTMSIALGAGTAFGQCDTATNEEFWFLGVTAAMDNSTTLPMGQLTYGTLLAGLDPTAPDAPTGLEASAGDRQIQIEWDNPAASGTLSAANIYVDTAGCDESGDVLPDGMLTDGGVAPSGAPQQVATGTAVRSATLDGEALGLEIGDYAAVAVSIVDQGNNESPLSNVVCIQRVEVRGFWDAYCADRGHPDTAACTDQYGCATGGGRGSLFGLGMVLGAILLVSRRRSIRGAR